MLYNSFVTGPLLCYIVYVMGIKDAMITVHLRKALKEETAQENLKRVIELLKRTKGNVEKGFAVAAVREDRENHCLLCDSGLHSTCSREGTPANNPR